MCRSRSRINVSLYVAALLALAVRGEAQTIPLAQPLPIDVLAAEVSGGFFLNGGPLPSGTSEVAVFSLTPVASSGAPVTLGTSLSPGFGPLWILAGEYQPTYSLIDNQGSTLPANATARVGPEVEIDSLANVDIDLPAMNTTLYLKIDGEDPPTTFGESAMLSLRNVDTGDTFPIGFAQNAPLAIHVTPGVYDLVYQYQSGSELPINTHAIVKHDIDLSAQVPFAIVVDIPTVFHGVSATLNGSAFPASAYEDGEILIENAESGDVVSWGLTSAPAGFQKIIAGTYDVLYAHESGGSIVPINQRAIVARDVVIDPPTHPWMISVTQVDVATHATNADATLDGLPFPASAYEFGQLVLVGERGDEALLELTHTPGDTRQVVEGRYDLEYRWMAGTSLVPRNTRGRLQRGVEIDQSMTLPIPVDTVEVTLDVQLDGAPFPASPYERGDFALLGRNPGDTIELGSSSEQQFVFRVLPGTYDLEYDYVAGSQIVPHNQGHRVETNLEFLRNRTRTIDVPTLTIVPSFTMNGLPFPTLAWERAELILRGPGGSALSLGDTNVSIPESQIAIQGAYAVDYAWQSGNQIPINPKRQVGFTSVPEPSAALGLGVGVLGLGMAARRSRRPQRRRGRGATPRALLIGLAFAIAQPASAQFIPLAHFFTVDVPSVEASGALVLDSAPTSPSASEFALVSLAPTDAPQESPIGAGLSTSQFYGPLRLVPGEYQPMYDFSFTSGGLPINTGTPIGSPIEIDGSDIPIEIETAEITFDLKLNGTAFPAAVGEFAYFRLHHRSSGAEFPLGTSAQSPITARVVPGRYDVIYAHGSGMTLPRNEHAVVAEDVLLDADQTLVVDVPAFVHFVTALHNGVPFTPSPLETGEIELRNFATGDSVSYGPTHAPDNPQLIIPGTYDVTYSKIAGGTASPANGEAVVEEGLALAPPLTKNTISISTVEVETFVVSRDVTIDGMPFVESVLERGRIVLVGPRGEEIDLGTTNDPSPSWRVVPGHYDVYYRQVQGLTWTPANENARIATGYPVLADTTVTLDIPSVVVDFEVTLNGSPFPESTAEYADIFLVGADDGDVIALGETYDSLTTVRLIVGEYDLVYDYDRGPNFIPRNRGAHLFTDVLFDADESVTVDVEPRLIVPSFLLDGAPFPDDPDHAGRIVLRDANGGELDLGTTDVVPPSIFSLEAPYAIEYKWEDGFDVPRNERVRVGFTTVPEPTFAAGTVAGMLALVIAGKVAPRRRTER